MGFYELECDWCHRTIHQSSVYAWTEEDGGPPYGYVTLHRNSCLREFLAVNDDKVWLHKGSPYFKLEMEYIGDTVILGTPAKHRKRS